MKVVLIGTMYPPYAFGGAEKAIAMLAEALVREGHDVAVITLHAGVSESLVERNGIRIYQLPMDNVYWPFAQTSKPTPLLRIAWHLREMWNWKAARRVGRILDLEAPDVVHTHNINGFSVAVWSAIKLRRIRLVHTLHDYYLLCPRTTLFRDGKLCKSRCIGCQLLTVNRRAASRIPDEIVSVSHFTLDKHQRLGFCHNVASDVIYNIQPSNEKIFSSAIEIENPEVLTFGFIGRIEPEKGIETLLQATQSLIQPGWRLKIAGRGTDAYVSSLRLKYTDERIEWLGYTTAAAFYSAIDVVVIPSQWDEPLGYVCVESLHAGKALICAQSGGLPEIAQLSKVVEYFPSGSAEALACLMKGALDAPMRWKENMPPLSVVLEQFTDQAVVGKYLSAYRSEAELACSVTRKANAL